MTDIRWAGIGGEAYEYDSLRRSIHTLYKEKRLVAGWLMVVEMGSLLESVQSLHSSIAASEKEEGFSVPQKQSHWRGLVRGGRGARGGGSTMMISPLSSSTAILSVLMKGGFSYPTLAHGCLCPKELGDKSPPPFSSSVASLYGGVTRKDPLRIPLEL